MPIYIVRESELLGRTAYPGRHGEIAYDCLFCPDESHHMYVNKLKGVFHCFKCGTGGRYVSSRKTSSVPLSDLETMAKDILQSSFDPKPRREIRSLPWCRPICPARGVVDSNPKSLAALAYLREREVSLDEIYENDIRYTLDSDGRYSRSVCFYCGSESKPYFFQCRRFDGSPGPKYISAPWAKESSLWRPSMFQLKPVPSLDDPLVVCEGPFDALNVGRAFASVSLFGKQATSQQVETLRGCAVPIVILLDPDAYTYAQALQLALVGNVFWVTVADNRYWPDGKDPGNMDLLTIRRVVNEAIQRGRRSSEGG